MKELFRPVYLLDAGICDAILKRSDPEVLKRLSMAAVLEVAMSSITYSDLAFAAAISRTRELDRRALALLVKHVAVLDYPTGAGEDYAEIREGMHWREESTAVSDVFLAAHARWLEMTLVTYRVKDFGRVGGLRVESWGG